MLLRAHAEITEILGGIRLTREAIEAHAVERIRETQSKLTDVTSTTESATLELMNGLDRSSSSSTTSSSRPPRRPPPAASRPCATR